MELQGTKVNFSWFLPHGKSVVLLPEPLRVEGSSHYGPSLDEPVMTWQTYQITQKGPMAGRPVVLARRDHTAAGVTDVVI